MILHFEFEDYGDFEELAQAAERTQDIFAAAGCATNLVVHYDPITEMPDCYMLEVVPRDKDILLPHERSNI